mmetsp:Transcript_26463/g.32180  ORF Transcript_26463/g.32180 Transcript_26463/m.32180 type:complete len:256 (-) Transcript_26463:543-1310(-)
MHSKSNNAHAAAVATPCCPAPVSAMMRFFPNFMASKACPMALLILCAPVCASSSRLNQICAPPQKSVKRLAKYKGVGPPMKSRRRRASSALKVGSTLHLAQASSNSWCATIKVSGMKRPPKTESPKFHLSACFFCCSKSAAVRWRLVGGSTFSLAAVNGPPESFFTKAPAASTPPFPSSWMILEPTTQPSAKAPNSSTCCRSEMPKPTTTGRSAPSFLAAFRTDSTTPWHSLSRRALASACSASRVPVTPSKDTT